MTNATIISMSKDSKKNKNVMEYLLKNFPCEGFKVNDIAEGKVLTKSRLMLYVDLGFSIGAVYGRDFIESRDLIKNLVTDDTVMVKVLDAETPEGFIALSLKEASKDVVWREAEDCMKQKIILNARVVSANKGGLILEWKGISGFIPTSHLRTEHYPRIEGGDKDKILEELKKIVGEILSVVITDINYKESALIFSEKNIKDESVKKAILKYKVGDAVEGEVSGIVDFGIFIKIEERLEGLVHISELDWSLVESPRDLFKIGDKVQAKVTSIENDKISLSIKALKPDPWEDVKDEYHKGDIVSGVVIRFNKHGTLISVREGVAGLTHISEFGDEKTMKSKLELGRSYYFQVTFFSPSEHRLTFGFVDENSPKK